MPTPEIDPRRHHVLLAGIDAYDRIDPLFGSVNDIDAVETLLLDRLGIPPEAITKLASPHPSQERQPRVPEKEATSANLRAALEALATDRIKPGDRVLVYYAGHGTQVLPRNARFAREALVPADVHDGGELLYDYELNDLLRRIARRTNDLTVILDCCCSAGATRSALRPPDSTVRFCRIEDSALPPPRAAHGRGATELPGGILGSLDPSDPGYLVAAACQSNEHANEGRKDHGRSHGAFTAALLKILAAHPASQLEVIRWADIWQSLRGHVSARYPGQHPWLIGRAERRLFGGPFRLQDPGYPIAREGDKYRIGAGRMVGLTEGARVAVYGAAPDFFPSIGSPEDAAARVGVLRVESATPSACTAIPIGMEFPVEAGARGRCITPGERDALVVQLDPYDAALAKWLQSEGRFRIVPADRAGSDIEEAFVGMDAGGMRWIGDEIYGPSTERDGEPPFVRIPAGDHDALLQGLLHYAKYNTALRLAKRCRDLPGALVVRLLDCRNLAGLAGANLQDPPLPEVPLDRRCRYRYLIDDGQPVCVVVENRSSERLYANLINCAASGRVEILGAMQLEIPPGRRQTFWLRGHLGEPFPCRVPPGRASGVERLIAVATTVPDVDLSFLRERKSFAEAIHAGRRDMGLDQHEPRELWTATLVTMKIARSPSGAP